MHSFRQYIDRSRRMTAAVRVKCFWLACCVLGWTALITPLGAQSDATPPGAMVPQRADLRGETAPDDVRLVADWMLRNNRHQGNPFIVADKLGGLVFAFDGTGKLLAKAPALFGRARSDVLTPEQADKKWEDTLDSDMITPAGIFPAQPYRSPSYGDSVKFAEFAYSNLLIHRAPVEWRRKNLQSGAKMRARVTYGCINVLPEFMDNVLVPNYRGASTVVILPENQPAKVFFAINDAPVPTAPTSVTRAQGRKQQPS